MQVAVSVRLNEELIDPKDPVGSVRQSMEEVTRALESLVGAFQGGSQSHLVRLSSGEICGVLRVTGKSGLPKQAEVSDAVP